MKQPDSRWFLRFALLGAFGLLNADIHAFAQTAGDGNSLIPVVTIRATDPIARESGDPATFEFDRQGPTNASLLVYYGIYGTASNGVDYVAISHFVSIPAGASQAAVTVHPLPDSGAETNEEGIRTVVLQLEGSPLMMPVNYEIGFPSNAVAYIFDDDAGTNLPPVVDIGYPVEGEVFYAPTNIGIIAKAFDADGSVTNVEFFAGTIDLGPGIPVVLDPPGVNGLVGLVYFLNWTDVPPGKYPITAVATDDGGASTTSGVVNIVVLPGPPPTNLPPEVRIISPANHSVFRAPVRLPLFAYAHDPDGTVDTVEFFAGTNSLGLGARLTPAAGATAAIFPTNLFALVWSNPPPGTYALTAVATDNDGASNTSAPVTVAILPPLPPPTNRPPIVSIVAVDPIAIEGTNCWVWYGLTNATPAWAGWATAACRPFTNCGPKNAIFAVRRCGDTNADLTVTYDIGGTASNGVDYVTLPGAVSIPAGERAVLIPVIPIDDGPPDVNKTVVLRLTPSANPVPDYLVGFPREAAALIIDSNRPRPCTGMTADRCFHVTATGPDGAWFRVECSTNLVDWTSICTNQVIDGSIDFVDPDAPASPLRFYRTSPELNPLVP
jgi:hypothetical protein